MEGNHRMGMVAIDSATGTVADCGCEVEILECEPLPDGRFYLEVNFVLLPDFKTTLLHSVLVFKLLSVEQLPKLHPCEAVSLQIPCCVAADTKYYIS